MTRRRLAASFAAMAGVVAGFPRDAEASCSGQAEFGLFKVTKRENGAHVWHKHRYGKYSLDAYLSSSQDARVDIYYYEIIEAQDFDAVFYFDDRTEYRLPVSVSGTYEERNPPFTLLSGWVAGDSALVRLIRAAQHVKITINRSNSRDVVFPTSEAIPLTGSSKAMKYAARGVRECLISQGGDYPYPEDCFLTTACVGMLGLRDDCYELRTLRGFRDGTMSGDPEGRAMAAAYRELAPAILAALPEADRERILRALYGRYILPSVLAVRLGLNGLARKIYVRGMVTLMRRYTPDLLRERREELLALFGERAARVL